MHATFDEIHADPGPKILVRLYKKKGKKIVHSLDLISLALHELQLREVGLPFSSNVFLDYS